MARHICWAALLAAAGFAGGCAGIPQNTYLSPSTVVTAPMPRDESLFAELQHDGERATDTNSSRQDAPKNPGLLVRANYGDDPRFTLPALPPRDTGPLFPLDDDVRPAANGMPLKQPGYVPLPTDGERLPSAQERDPGTRAQATISGQRLQLGPNENATERAVLLAQMLETAQTESRGLRDRIRSLDVQIQEVEQSRNEERTNARQSATELARNKTRLESLNEEVVALRERLRRAERQDMETMQEICSALEKVLQADPARKSTR